MTLRTATVPLDFAPCGHTVQRFESCFGRCRGIDLGPSVRVLHFSLPCRRCQHRDASLHRRRASLTCWRALRCTAARPRCARPLLPRCLRRRPLPASSGPGVHVTPAAARELLQRFHRSRDDRLVPFRERFLRVEQAKALATPGPPIQANSLPSASRMEPNTAVYR